MTNNTTPLLAAFGIGMGLSSDDMHDVIMDTMAALPDDETLNERSPLDNVVDVAKDMDAKTLWIGAMLYGYILDSYEDIDVSDAINRTEDE